MRCVMSTHVACDAGVRRPWQSGGVLHDVGARFASTALSQALCEHLLAGMVGWLALVVVACFTVVGYFFNWVALSCSPRSVALSQLNSIFFATEYPVGIWHGRITSMLNKHGLFGLLIRPNGSAISRTLLLVLQVMTAVLVAVVSTTPDRM
jgi:hypothetical protein